MATWSVTAAGVTVTTAVDLLRLTAPTAQSIRIKWLAISADAASTAVPVIGLYKASTPGTGGAALTAVPFNASSGTYAERGGSAAALLTGAATASPAQPVWREQADLSAGYRWEPGGDLEILPGQHFVVRTGTTIASTVMSISLEFETVGD